MAADDHRTDQVAAYVHDGAAHVQEPVHAEDQADALRRDAEHHQDHRDHRQRPARHPRRADAAQHAHQQHQDLLGQAEFDAEELRQEQDGDAFEQRRAVHVGGGPHRAHEARDRPRHPQVLLGDHQRGRQGRRRGRGRERGQQCRLGTAEEHQRAHPAEQQQQDREHHEHVQAQRREHRADELRQLDQHVEPEAGGDREQQRSDGVRRQLDDPVDQLQADLVQPLHGADEGLRGRRAQDGRRDAEHHREEDDRDQVAVRGGLHRVAGNDVEQDVDPRHALALGRDLPGALRAAGQQGRGHVLRDPGARLEQVHDDHPDGHRRGGDHQDPDQRAPADAAE